MSTEARARHGLALEITALTAVFGLIVISACRVIWDIDVFWHIAAGRAFLQEGALPSTDIFSAIDPEKTWISFQWGYEVLVYGLDQLGGLHLVRFFHSGLMVLAFFLLWWGFRRRLSLGPWISLFLLALVFVLFEDRIRIRPHVFNLLGWSILFPWLARGPRRLDRVARLTHLAVVATWANIHAGGALIYLVAAGTLPAGALLGHLAARSEASRADFKRALVWYLWALIPALISPNFVMGNVQALTMLGGTEQVIGEWFPSWHFLGIASSTGHHLIGHYLAGLFPTLLLILWLLCVVNLLVTRRRGDPRADETRRALPAWRVLLVLAMVVVSHRSVRFVYMAGLGLVFLWPVLALHLDRATRGVIARRVALGAMVLGLLAAAYQFNISVQHGSLDRAVARAFGDSPIDARRFPVAQADHLEATRFRGRIFAQANWGGYLLYRLWPGVMVTADGRGNYARGVADDLGMLMDRRVMADARNGPLVETIYTRYPIDIVVHQTPTWPAGYRPDPARWVRVQGDEKGAIWVRRGTIASDGYLAAQRRNGGKRDARPSTDSP